MTTDPRPDPSRAIRAIDPERLAAFLAGDLPASEAREVALRVAADPALAREVAEHRAVWEALGAYADEPVPPGFAERAVAAALGHDAEDAAPRASFALLRGGRARAAAVAAAVLLALGVGMAVGRVTAPEPASPPAVAIETIPEDVLAAADVELLARLSDEDFEVLLSGNPEDLADAAQGG
jgi:anti-sigma factor RsiW